MAGIAHNVVDWFINWPQRINWALAGFTGMISTLVVIFHKYVVPAGKWLLNPLLAPGRIEKKLTAQDKKMEEMQAVQDRRHAENQEWLETLSGQIQVNTQWTRDNTNEWPSLEMDGNGNCIWVNAEWCRMTGLTFTESLALGWTQAFSNDERERVIDEWRKCVKEERVFRVEPKFRSTGKSAEAYGLPIKCRRGRIAAFTMQVRWQKGDLKQPLQVQT